MKNVHPRLAPQDANGIRAQLNPLPEISAATVFGRQNEAADCARDVHRIGGVASRCPP